MSDEEAYKPFVPAPSRWDRIRTRLRGEDSPFRRVMLGCWVLGSTLTTLYLWGKAPAALMAVVAVGLGWLVGFFGAVGLALAYGLIGLVFYLLFGVEAGTFLD